jgi:Na+/melibiose symporter-like transporter
VVFQNLIIQGQPQETRGENIQALLIEGCNSIYLYIMLMLTDFTGENPFREQQGWALAMLVSGIVAINFIIFLVQAVKKTIVIVKHLTFKIRAKLDLYFNKRKKYASESKSDTRE